MNVGEAEARPASHREPCGPAHVSLRGFSLIVGWAMGRGVCARRDLADRAVFSDESRRCATVAASRAFAPRRFSQITDTANAQLSRRAIPTEPEVGFVYPWIACAHVRAANWRARTSSYASGGSRSFRGPMGYARDAGVRSSRARGDTFLIATARITRTTRRTTSLTRLIGGAT